MAYPYKGKWGSKWYATKASTAYAVGDLIGDDGTNLIPSTATLTQLVAICDQVKAVGDATTTRIKFRVPKDQFATFISTVTGTMTAAMEGNRYDLSDSTTVNVGATTYKVVRAEKFISATKGEFSISPAVT